MLRVVTLFSLTFFASASWAQSTDAWLQQAIKLKQEGWAEKASQVLPDLERPIAPFITFVSFSMPEDSLKAILNQTRQIGGQVVMRGLLNNSFTDTANMLASFSEQGSPGFNVDPKLFKTYDIKSVPTFVLTNEDQFDKISGNLSLSATLQAFVEEGDHPDKAQALLNQLQETSP